jgi:hypothetical protein
MHLLMDGDKHVESHNPLHSYFIQSAWFAKEPPPWYVPKAPMVPKPATSPPGTAAATAPPLKAPKAVRPKVSLFATPDDDDYLLKATKTAAKGKLGVAKKTAGSLFDVDDDSDDDWMK